MHSSSYFFATTALITTLTPAALAQSCPTSDEWAATASDGNRYGRAVEINDGFLAVGDYSANSYTGRVYLREWDEDEWGDPQILDGAGAGEEFGSHVSISDGWMAISAPEYDNGVVDLYSHNGSIWNFEDSYETGIGYVFNHMDLSYPWLAVAERSDDYTDLRVKMLRYDAVGYTWSVIETLAMPPDSGSWSFVALDGDLLLIGLPGADVGANENCGTVRSYQLNAGTWDSLGYSTMSETDGLYGHLVTVDADTNTRAFAQHGAYHSDTYNDAVLSVDHFNGTSWDSEPITGSLPWSAEDSQINYLAIEGDDLVVVLWSNVHSESEFSTHHLQRSSGVWYYQGELAPNGAETDYPRYVAAMDDGMLVMDGGNATTERVAWVLPPNDCDDTGKADSCEVLLPGADGNSDSIIDRCACPGDLDFNGDRDGEDIVAFLSLWAGATAAGDLDADGEVGVLDLLVILTQWGDCP